jgi:hypothetical protein
MGLARAAWELLPPSCRHPAPKNYETDRKFESEGSDYVLQTVPKQDYQQAQIALSGLDAPVSTGVCCQAPAMTLSGERVFSFILLTL